MAACKPHAKQVQETGYVMDKANILSPEFERDMNTKLGAYERVSHHQFVVVATAGMGGQPVAQYSLALANRLQIGRKGFDDGLMLLIAPVERKIRIEVGKGLESSITNGEAKSIIDANIVPALRKNDFAAGVRDGVDAMMKEAP